MTVVRRESLAEQAAALLLARLRDGEWEIGSKLPGETTLAPQLGVGRSTAREAIRILAGQGILATRQGAGVFVTSTETAEPWNSVLRRADIAAVLEARTAVEAEAAVLAAGRRSPAEVDAIAVALAARDAQQGDARARVEVDMAFHRSIVVAAHSPILLDLFDSFAPRSLQAMTDMLALGAHPVGDDDQRVHADITAAIAAGDADRAGTLTRAHLAALTAQLA